MKHMIYQTEMLSRLDRTSFSFAEIYTITTYYSDGSVETYERPGKLHFVTQLTFN
jgi:hypothetical protein